MPDILELAPFDVSRLHWQAFGGTFQGLDTGHLVDRNGLTALSATAGAVWYTAQMSAHFVVELGIGLRRQPVTDAMRLKVRFFLKSARPSRARYF